MAARAGERVTIAQTEGHQVGDLIAFNAADPTGFLSPSRMRRCLSSIRMGQGSSRENPEAIAAAAEST